MTTASTTQVPLSNSTTVDAESTKVPTTMNTDFLSDDNNNDDADVPKSASETDSPSPSPLPVSIVVLQKIAADSVKKRRPRTKLDMNARVQSVLRICRVLSTRAAKSGKKDFHTPEKQHGISKNIVTSHGKIAKELLETYDISEITEEIVRNAILHDKDFNPKLGRPALSILNEEEENYIVQLVEQNPTLTTGKICQQFQRKFGKPPCRQRLARLLRSKGLQTVRIEARKAMSAEEKAAQEKDDIANNVEKADGDAANDDNEDDAAAEGEDSSESSASGSAAAVVDDDDEVVQKTKKAKKTAVEKEEQVPTQQALYDIMLGDDRGFDHAAFDKRPTTRAKRDVSVETKTKKKQPAKKTKKPSQDDE